jgi:hypothetical protein
MRKRVEGSQFREGRSTGSSLLPRFATRAVDAIKRDLDAGLAGDRRHRRNGSDGSQLFGVEAVPGAFVKYSEDLAIAAVPHLE